MSRRTSRLSGIDLRVADLSASLRFYRDLVGLPLDEPGLDAPGDDEHTHAAWGTAEDGTLLMLTLRPAGIGATSRIRLGFTVHDLDARHARIVRAGIEVERAPRDLPWGRVATYFDPDRNIVSLLDVKPVAGPREAVAVRAGEPPALGGFD